MKAMMGLERAAAESLLPAALRELVKIRASHINGCAYCVDMHSQDALKGGEDVRRLLALPVWRETPFFSERERAALLWTETLTELSKHGAPDDVYRVVATHFSEQEMSELTFVIGAINAWNRFGVGFAMQPQ
ncbi:carboxymuconolactone decarboxylase family protein [Pseudoduganella violaceinigra]|uniref:carboxymuconolactone decarboxylase family protein n=1 Tax=Pseudoduganella violaceinigra TaxID=246602 RepID=UPI00068879DB|nr:carboxymuconolactone decarboxylase family protein [Pseudoduganella violaceinigra]